MARSFLFYLRLESPFRWLKGQAEAAAARSYDGVTPAGWKEREAQRLSNVDIYWIILYRANG
ncbi:MAG: hypothetical protein AB1656_26470 [Candidatus Omnitrophota bacterium]